MQYKYNQSIKHILILMFLYHDNYTYLIQIMHKVMNCNDMYYLMVLLIPIYTIYLVFFWQHTQLKLCLNRSEMHILNMKPTQCIILHSKSILDFSWFHCMFLSSCICNPFIRIHRMPKCKCHCIYLHYNDHMFNQHNDLSYIYQYYIELHLRNMKCN
jgi:hypothetical protein